MLVISLIQAESGDCFHFKSSAENIDFLVDCGFKKTYVNKIRGVIKSTNFIILTHVDADHIAGAIPLVKDYPEKFDFKTMYFNTPGKFKISSVGGEISIRQAISLDSILKEKEVDCRGLMQGDILQLSEGSFIEVISPGNTELTKYLEKYENEVDERQQGGGISTVRSEVEPLEVLAAKGDSYKSIYSDIINASSIAFIMNYREHKMLILGDSHPLVIEKYLERLGYSEENKLDLEMVKLSHHGSINSISNKIISMIRCSKYIISTNGGLGRARHPSRETLAKLIVNVDRGVDEKIRFFFNYPINIVERKQRGLLSSNEKREYNVEVEYVSEVLVE